LSKKPRCFQISNSLIPPWTKTHICKRTEAYGWAPPIRPHRLPDMSSLLHWLGSHQQELPFGLRQIPLRESFRHHRFDRHRHLSRKCPQTPHPSLAAYWEVLRYVCHTYKIMIQSLPRPSHLLKRDRKSVV